MALNNMQYDEIIRSYNRITFENKREQDRRTREVFDKVPRIREINEEISSLSLNTTKTLLLNSDTGALDSFKKKIKELKAEKSALLKAAGYPDNYLDIRYKCEACKDTGYVNNQKCKCFKKAEIELLYDQSNIKEKLKRENFDTFNINIFNDVEKDLSTDSTPKQNMIEALKIAHSFVDDFDREDKKYKNLLLFGKTGVGKTFLSSCIAKELIDKSYSVIYISSISLFDILADAEFSRDNIDAKHKAEQISHCDLLIIDDLGTELSNAYTNSALFSILNERLVSTKATIISTNLAFPEIMQRYSERITSRLTKDYTFIKIIGDDLRHTMRIKP